MYTQANFQILGRPGPDRRSIRYGLAHDGHVAALMRPGHAPGLFLGAACPISGMAPHA